MTPPQKKAVPSLRDLGKKEDNKNEDVNTPEENTDKVDVGERDPRDTPGSVVVEEPNKNVDHTVSDDIPVLNKTPADLASETPQQTAKRYGIDNTVTDEVHNNPNINANKDMRNSDEQVASGTHLHPDIAKDLANRNLSGTTESGEVVVTRTQRVFAEEAPLDDKGRQGHSLPGDDDGIIFEGVENNFADENKNNDKQIKKSDER